MKNSKLSSILPFLWDVESNATSFVTPRQALPMENSHRSYLFPMGCTDQYRELFAPRQAYPVRKLLISSRFMTSEGSTKARTEGSLKCYTRSPINNHIFYEDLRKNRMGFKVLHMASHKQSVFYEELQCRKV
jgi:hypothetical protein